MMRYLSTSQVAAILQVTATSVANWVDQGKLPAGRTAGGHRKILAGDLVEFLKKQKLPVPTELVASLRPILVVDDQPEVAAWIADEIAADYPDLEILVAHDGFSAGDLVGSRKPAVVILDLRMPGMDGFEVCRRICEKPDTQRPQVIAITGHPSPQAEATILGLGARAYLTKPLDRQRLMDELAAAMNL